MVEDIFVYSTGLGVVHWKCKCTQPNALERTECVNCGKPKPANIKLIPKQRGKPWKGRGRKPKNWNGLMSE